MANAGNKEEEIILPPPSARNPIPSLSTALRVDNQEQVLDLLETTPDESVPQQFQQILIFPNESYRTLMMRQVLSDPHGRKWANPHKNWDANLKFPVAAKSVVGTGILGEELLYNTPDIITYFMRANDSLEKLHQMIMEFKTAYHRVVFIPHVSAMTQKLLEDMGIVHRRRVSIQSLQLDVFPLEGDLFSMEMEDSFREISVEGTPSTVITDTARSILKLQDIVGTIPRIQAYGVTAEEVVKKTLSLSVEEHLANPAAEDFVSDTVAALVVIDRSIDLVTPMLTPLTYEGLLDDVLGVDVGFLHIPTNLINSSDEQQQQDEIIALAVNESDSLFSEIRNLHVEKFGSFLQNKARELEKTKKDFSETGRDKPLPELQKFVRQLPSLQHATRSLTNHVNLAEVVKKTSEQPIFRERWHMERTMIEGDLCLDDLDDLVASDYEPFRFFRLLCLQSICKNGISSSRYDSLRRDVVQTYGYEYLFFLGNLEKAGLLRRKEAFLGMDKPSRFVRLKESLRLIVPEVDSVEPDDISFVSSGYAPLTVRLVQSAANGWKNGRDDILREIPGRFIDILQQFPPEDLSTTLKRPLNTGTAYGSLETSNNGAGKQVLIMWFVGGVTPMELAALRFLSNDSNFAYQIICCTSKVLNGTDMLKSLQ